MKDVTRADLTLKITTLTNPESAVEQQVAVLAGLMKSLKALQTQIVQGEFQEFDAIKTTLSNSENPDDIVGETLMVHVLDVYPATEGETTVDAVMDSVVSDCVKGSHAEKHVASVIANRTAEAANG